jgi:hypothetical protein
LRKDTAGYERVFLVTQPTDPFDIKKTGLRRDRQSKRQDQRARSALPQQAAF